MTILARARIILEADTVALTRALKGAEASMRQSGVRMSQMGRTLSTRVTLPLLAMGAGVAKAFGDFDSAMVQSIAIMGDVSDVLQDEMAEAAKLVARETTVAAKEAAEAFFFLASAGLDAERSIAALPQVARFAEAGMFGMARATDLATDAQSALGLTVQDAEQNLVNLTRVTDVLVKANTLANATVSQFSEALTREAGAALKTFNVDIEAGVAVLAAFADQGVKSNIAGSSLARILRLMSAAAVNNKVELRELNIAIFDSQGKIRNLANIIEDMENAFGPMSDEMRTAKLESIGFTAKVQGILLPLLGTSAAIRKYEAALRDAAGITREVAEKQLRAFSAQMKITWNNIVLAAIALGETLAPALLTVGGFVRDFSLGLAASSENTRKWILSIAGLTLVMGPLLLALGTMLKLIAALKIAAIITGFIGWAQAVGLLVLQVNSLSAALTLLKIAIGPAGWIVLGIGAVITAVVLWIRAQRNLGEAFADTVDKLNAYREGLTDLTKVQLEAQRSLILEGIRTLNRELGRLKGRLEGARLAMIRQPLGDATVAYGELQDRIGQTEAALDTLGQKFDITEARLKEVRLEANQTRSALALLEDQLAAMAVDTDAVAEAMAGLVAVQTALPALEQALGAEFDAQAAEANALQAAIETLALAGVSLDFILNEEGATLRQLSERYRELRREIEDAEEFQRGLTQAEIEAKQIIQSLLTPTEIYAATMERLERLRPDLGQEAYNRAVAQAEEVLASATEEGDRWGETMQRAAQNALESFVAFTTGAGQSFGDFIEQALRDLSRLTARLVITGLLENVGTSGGGGQVPGKQRGGFVGAGQLALVGETGPELIRAGRGGVSVTPLRGMSFSDAGGGGAQVSVTIQAVDARSFAELVEDNPGALTAPIIRALSRSRTLQGFVAR